MVKLSHANVGSIFDVGVHEGQVFLAMEYLPGGTLRDWLVDEKPPCHFPAAILRNPLGNLCSEGDLAETATAFRAAIGLAHGLLIPAAVMWQSGKTKGRFSGGPRSALRTDGPRTGGRVAGDRERGGGGRGEGERAAWTVRTERPSRPARPRLFHQTTTGGIETMYEQTRREERKQERRRNLRRWAFTLALNIASFVALVLACGAD